MTHTHSDRKDLNLPMALLKESKDSDLAQMLLRFAVCIKCAYGDSRMPDVSESAIVSSKGKISKKIVYSYISGLSIQFTSCFRTK